MRLILVASTLLACAATAAAQTPPIVSIGTHTGSTASIDDVVSRLMSFDRNHDGSVTEDELIERMRPLVARGDANGNHALDRSEIVTLARTQPPRPPATSPFLSPGYALGHEVGVTSRAHIEGAIEDLRLPPSTRDEALARANSFLDAHEKEAHAELMKQMEQVLTASQWLDFAAAVGAEQERGKTSHIMFTMSDGMTTRVQVAVRSKLGPRLDGYRLSPEQHAAATAAIERFDAAFRPGDVEWAPLLRQMEGVLSDTQREDLQAALDRQPIVRMAPMLFKAHVDVIRHIDVESGRLVR